MLHDEFLYFIENQEDLVRRYQGKFIVIKGRSVVGQYDSQEDAYNNALKTNPLGTFLIQQCEPGPAAYTVALHPQMTAA